MSLRALVFDVFGTVVDWRTSVIDEVSAFAKRKGASIDAAKFADAWRFVRRPQEFGPDGNPIWSLTGRWTCRRTISESWRTPLARSEYRSLLYMRVRSQSRRARAAAMRRFSIRSSAAALLMSAALELYTSVTRRVRARRARSASVRFASGEVSSAR